MDITKIKNKYVGKELKIIITLEINDENSKYFRNLVNDEYSGEGIDNIQILLFENNLQLAFVDFDCDGYRSGQWHLFELEQWLDKGNTKEIKNINSKVKDVEYCEINNQEFVLITTDEYIIKMGQDYVDDYYPANFFNVEECKKLIKEGKV